MIACFMESVIYVDDVDDYCVMIVNEI